MVSTLAIETRPWRWPGRLTSRGHRREVRERSRRGEPKRPAGPQAGAVVGGHDEQRVVVEPHRAQAPQQLAEQRVDELYLEQVPLVLAGDGPGVVHPVVADGRDDLGAQRVPFVRSADAPTARAAAARAGSAAAVGPPSAAAPISPMKSVAVLPRSRSRRVFHRPKRLSAGAKSRQFCVTGGRSAATSSGSAACR